MEGGANVVSEAVMAGLPVIASDIEGSVGLLGRDYPGYYPVQDTGALRERLLQAESDGGYYAALEAACAARRRLFMPQQEQAGWETLLADIEGTLGSGRNRG
jgi:glycosyltransferase involved in cell wall biosynthesis